MLYSTLLCRLNCISSLCFKKGNVSVLKSSEVRSCVILVLRRKADVGCISVSCTLGDWSSAQNITGVYTQQPSRWIWLCWPNFWMHRIQHHLPKLNLLLGGLLKFPSLTICKERRSHQNKLIQTFQKRCLAASMYCAWKPLPLLAYLFKASLTTLGRSELNSNHLLSYICSIKKVL